jgi:hypothetical protein
MLSLPLVLLDILKFWFYEGPVGLIQYFSSFNTAFLKFFSFQLLARTYFKPWKNEYRQGLVGFSIGMGMVIKSFILLMDLAILVVFLFVELGIVIGFVTWPFLTVAVLFI